MFVEEPCLFVFQIAHCCALIKTGYRLQWDKRRLQHVAENTHTVSWTILGLSCVWPRDLIKNKFRSYLLLSYNRRHVQARFLDRTDSLLRPQVCVRPPCGAVCHSASYNPCNGLVFLLLHDSTDSVQLALLIVSLEDVPIDGRFANNKTVVASAYSCSPPHLATTLARAHGVKRNPSSAARKYATKENKHLARTPTTVWKTPLPFPHQPFFFFGR